MKNEKRKARNCVWGADRVRPPRRGCGSQTPPAEEKEKEKELKRERDYERDGLKDDSRKDDSRIGGANGASGTCRVLNMGAPEQLAPPTQAARTVPTRSSTD